MRRHGEPRIHGQTYRVRPGVYAILPKDNSLLLTHQAEPHNEFQLPGGGVDQGESSLAALHREVLEETGWRIAAPKFIGAFRRFVFMAEYDMWAEKICKLYVALPVRSLGAPREAGHTAIWTPKESALELLQNEGDRNAVARFLT